MRIGIITYQDTTNFGASLQCFALYKSVNEINKNTEVINYINNYMKTSTIKKRILAIPLKLKKKSFDTFNYKYIKLSKQKYNKKNISNTTNIYDFFIIGSDQLWNYNINGGDLTYMLDFVKEKDRIMTYATSLGICRIEKNLLSLYKKHLEPISKLSVREKEGLKIMYTFVNPQKYIYVMPDPIFLLSKEEWNNIIRNNHLKNYSIKVNKTYCTYFLNYNTKKNFDKNIKSAKKLKNLLQIKLAGGIKFRDLLNKRVEVNLSADPLYFIKKIVQS